MKNLAPIEGSFPGLNFFYAHQIGSVISRNGKITEDEWKILNKLYPKHWWKARYVPDVAPHMLTHKDIETMNKHKEEFIHVWLQIAKRNPSIIFEHSLQAGALAWKIFYPPDYYYYSVGYGFGGTRVGFKRESKLPTIQKKITSMLDDLNTPKYNWLFFRAPLFLYISLLFTLLFCIKEWTFRGILPVLPLVANSLGIFLFSTAQDTRFMYGAILLAPILIGYFFSRMDCKKKALSPLGSFAVNSLFSSVLDLSSVPSALSQPNTIRGQSLRQASSGDRPYSREGQKCCAISLLYNH